MTKYFFYTYLLSFLFCLSCNLDKENKLNKALDLSEENRPELEKVLKNYSLPKDSLKLKSAKHLIENMVYHAYIDEGGAYDIAFKNAKITKDSLLSVHPKAGVAFITNIVKPVFCKTIDSLENSPNFKKLSKRVLDITSINSEFLIDNIEDAFKAFEQNPLNQNVSFDNFLQYVLPYRALNEPIEIGKRSELFNKYKWALDSLKTQPLDSVVNQIFKDLKLSVHIFKGPVKYNYKSVPSLSEIEATRMGYCEQLCMYMTNVLRSIGIPSGIDRNLRWGVDYKSTVHSWCFYLDGTRLKAFNLGNNEFKIINDIYKRSTLTKVYRNRFDNTIADVTNQYRDTEDFEIELLWNINNLTTDNIFLGVFNTSTGWDPIASPYKIKNNKAYFKNISNNLIYSIYSEKDGGRQMLNSPFKLEKNGVLKFFNKQNNEFEKINLLRKYPPGFPRIEHRKIARMKSLDGTILQGSNSGSNNSFKNLYTIKRHRTTQNIKLKLNKNVKYKHLRLKGDSLNTYLANFKLLDTNMQVIKNWHKTVRWENNLKTKFITDNDQLTFINDKNLCFTYSFKKPIYIGGFEIQSLNDGNHIDINDLYELFYWDKKWLSLGQQKAKDTFLTYNNVPKNAIYWLKNYTKGKEECIFTLDENGDQVWTGI